jgi:membrane-associated phospholipid phosphatase
MIIPSLFVSYIGLYGPVILFVLTLFFLRNKTNYLTFFVSGFALNNILNIILKLAIKEPRPTGDQKAIEIAITNGMRVGFDKFGMPSGHAQNCAYCLSFIMFTLHNPVLTTLYMVVTLITTCQRYIYKNHSILQLLVGLTIGSLFGYLTYYFGRKHITGNIKMRPDDYGPL